MKPISIDLTNVNDKYHDFISLFNASKPEFIYMSMTHSSYANDHNLPSNERLEFLGDSVLGCIVAEYLYAHSKKSEGSLSKSRSALVCEQALSQHAREMCLGKYLLTGKSCKNKPISEAMLCDLVEAMIGAMFLTFGYDKVKPAILKMLDIDTFLRTGNDKGDYKSILQEYCQAHKMSVAYSHTSEVSKGGQDTFIATVTIDGKDMAFGKGSNVKIAEKNAAKLAYDKLIKMEKN